MSENLMSDVDVQQHVNRVKRFVDTHAQEICAVSMVVNSVATVGIFVLLRKQTSLEKPFYRSHSLVS